MSKLPNKRLFKLAGVAAAISLLSACGGSSSSAIDDIKDDITDNITDTVTDTVTDVLGETIYEGTFVDSAVAGITYECGDQTGVTDAEGTFEYQAGDSCTFKIGDFSLGTVANMTEEAPVITPFDVAADDDQAIKIASLLQTIDADGNPENGIDITAFDSTGLTAALFTGDEETFYQAVFELTGLEAVTLKDAQEHIGETIGALKGYHSSAIEAVITKVEAVDDVEQLDIQTFLSEIHDILDAGDDSDNNDIAALKAIIAIYEILNNDIVAARVDITGDSSNYTEFLPQIIDASINASEVMLKDGTGSTADLSNLLFDFSTRLAAASDALGESFEDPGYVANYGTDDSGNPIISLTAETAYGIQATALGYSSILSYFSAYNYASDDYYIVKNFSGEMDIIEVVTGENPTFTPNTITADADYLTSDIHPESLYNDTNFGRLHTDAKHLTLAKTSLISLVELGKKLYSLESVDSATVQQDNIEIVDAYLANLAAADGSTSPVDLSILSDDNEVIAGTMNLQALYSIDSALDREDFDITASIECGELTYSEDYSKFVGSPMCSLGEYQTGTPIITGSTEIIDYNEMGYTAIYAISAEFNLEIEPKSDELYKRLVPTCTSTEDSITSDCVTGE